MDELPELEMTMHMVDGSSEFCGCQGSGGDKMSELFRASERSSPQRVEEVEESNRREDEMFRWS